MTSSLLDEAAQYEPPPPSIEDEWGAAVLDAPDPPKRKRGRPRKQPEIDPETGKEIPPVKRTYTPRTGKLKEELLEPYVELAANLAIAAPTVSGVLILRAEKTVDGLVDLASGHPRVLAALKKATKASKGADVVETVLLVMVAAAVDMGKVPAAHPILDKIGHSEIVKDEKGNPRKEGNKILKERTTLREIYNQMHPEGEEVAPAGPPPPPTDSVAFPFEMTKPLHPPVPMNNLFVENGSKGKHHG
jgi:hypothetical protein